jgi:hypothetical protein
MGDGIMRDCVRDRYFGRVYEDVHATYQDWLSGDASCADPEWGETFADWVESVRYWEGREGFTTEAMRERVTFHDGCPRVHAVIVALWFAEADRLAAADADGTGGSCVPGRVAQ